MDATKILPLAPQHLVPAAAILADGFAHKEPFVWLIPDVEARAISLPAFFEATLRYIHPPDHGTEVAVVGDEVAGCAIWAPPGYAKETLANSVASAWFLLRRLGWRGLRDLGQRGPLLERALRANRPTEPHWYLVGLGVASRHQGVGIGTALLRSGLARCDTDRQAVYLECLEPLVPYHEAFGFGRCHQIAVDANTPVQYGLWRPPSA